MAVAAAIGSAFVIGGATAAPGKRRGRTLRRAVGEGTPYDYYGLLGLERYTKDRKQIKSAFRRVVKLVHPDILGSRSEELQRLVGDAYATLSDDRARKEYDDMLSTSGASHGSIGRSQWPSDAPPGVKAIFVDQTRCQGCFGCVDMAGSTFTEDPGQGSARVAVQWGDSEENVEVAIDNCPSKAVFLVPREDLPFLEKAMGEWLERRSKVDIKGSELAGPFEAYQQYQFTRLEVMDFNDPDGARAVAEKVDALTAEVGEMSSQANEISEAAQAIPEDVRQKVWGGDGDGGSAEAPAFIPDGCSLQAAGNRARLVRELFRALDTDDDGWLREQDMRRFADCLGFEGSDSDWREEYRLLCTQNLASPMEGVGEILLLKLVSDTEDAFYCTDEELNSISAELAAEAAAVAMARQQY